MLRNKSFLRILIILFVLNLSGACSRQLKRSEVENKELKKMVTIKIVDAETGEPISEGLCFLSQKKVDAPNSGSCSKYVAIGQEGIFSYIPKKFNDRVSFWFLAPGYKSVTLLYDKEVRMIGEIFGGEHSHSGPGSVVLGLLSMIPTGSDLQTELESSVTTLPLHSFRDKDPELWQAELSLGLWTLRQAVAGTAKDTLDKFIIDERQKIGLFSKESAEKSLLKVRENQQ